MAWVSRPMLLCVAPNYHLSWYNVLYENGDWLWVFPGVVFQTVWGLCQYPHRHWHGYQAAILHRRPFWHKDTFALHPSPWCRNHLAGQYRVAIIWLCVRISNHRRPFSCRQFLPNHFPCLFLHRLQSFYRYASNESCNKCGWPNHLLRRHLRMPASIRGCPMHRWQR